MAVITGYNAGGDRDVTLGEGDDLEEEDGEDDAASETGPETPRPVAGGGMEGKMYSMMEKFFTSQSSAFEMIAKDVGKKRRREEDEEEDVEVVKAQPKMIDVPGHHLRDDAHTVLDWTARLVRPYNGGDWDLYWSKMPRKATPVMEDIKKGHLTKAPINPNVIAKLHDRGKETAAKQWLSANYSVEDRPGKIRAKDDRSAGAFLLDYESPRGVWEAVDAVHNYTMALRMVRPDDWTGELLLRTLQTAECSLIRALTPRRRGRWSWLCLTRF